MTPLSLLHRPSGSVFLVGGKESVWLEMFGAQLCMESMVEQLEFGSMKSVFEWSAECLKDRLRKQMSAPFPVWPRVEH